MVKKKRMEEIKREIEREFPDDFALQQVHIARRKISEEAKEKKISLLKYIKMQAKEARKVVHGIS